MPAARPRSLLLPLALLLVIGVMLTLVSYSVTLYRLFCEATGAGGTTQRAASATAPVSDRTITVRFNTDTAPGLPWRFTPAQKEVTLRLGEDTVVFFVAENLSDEEITGHATFNVTPEKTGLYFKKIECFCFTEERLGARQRVEMPVDFYVDPAIAADPGTRDVREITLSYTFFRSAQPGEAQDLARFTAAGPDPAAGGKIFAAQCATCHALDTAKIGPPLGGVLGRKAGSVPGYPYSKALAASGLVWTPETLDRWLAGPRELIPGSAMPMALADPAARADVIAWLRQGGGAAGEAKGAARAAVSSRPPG